MTFLRISLNLSEKERDTLCSLKNDNTIVIKGAGKGSGVNTWGREDYLIEAHKQLPDKAFYEEITNDPSNNPITNNPMILRLM